MSDIAVLAALVKSTFLEVGKQQQALGEGLLSAAPGEKTGTPNKSVQYLLEGGESLIKAAEACDELIQAAAPRSSNQPKA